MTHTPYQRGRRAAERGTERVAPSDLRAVEAVQWLAGYDSTRHIESEQDKIEAIVKKALERAVVYVSCDEVATVIAAMRDEGLRVEVMA